MTTTPAGWYPASEGPYEQWWDGQAWTDQKRPLQPQPQVGVQQPSVAVTRSRKQTSHGLHLFLTIITAGLWGIFVWLPITLWHKFGPRSKEVTRYR